ncbi:MAG: hypothetical protein HC929_04345 [Leptolyngbyaceae cyanobacterium SM2_5_2]|nr:hypothetical protein [Leptolyngbyaceae cyanobacterium SM2_5_2]
MPTLEIALNPNHPQAEVLDIAAWPAWFNQWTALVELVGSPLTLTSCP